MPELAEVEWFRKQWDAGRGGEIVDLSLHARNRIFRGSDVGKLRQRLIAESLLRPYARGNSAVSAFIMGLTNPIGGRAALPKSFRASSTGNLSTNSWTDI